MEILGPKFKSEMQLGALTFFAKQHEGDTCGSNGLPLTPNSIIMYGRAQKLKTFEHPFLCNYLDIIRGKHERTIVVSQHCGKPLSELLGKKKFTYDDIRRITYQLLSALQKLHEMNIVHRNLCNENILLQENGDIILFNYGLYYMTGCGQLVSFPIMQTLYSAPEDYLSTATSFSSSKTDIWSIGIVLVELVLDRLLWTPLKLGQRIRKVLSLIQCNTSVFERITREHNCYEVYQDIPEDLKEIIELCLNIYPSNRPTCKELLEKLKVKLTEEVPNNRSKICKPYKTFTIKELYHWWQLAGGDIFQELKKQGLIRSSPPILSLPNLVLIEGNILGQERNPATLYDPKIVQMPLDTLYQRLQHIPLTCYYPLLYTKSRIISKSEPLPYNATGLPLVIKEKDPEYQFHRVILLRRLLHGYPFTRDLIIKEAAKDIPPILRGDIWAALLNVKGNYEEEYMKIDKDTTTTTDRQIEVDIPRCHQYNELLSSTEGHRKLKRILKAWVFKNSQYVYWQGLDSLTAPFLYLNFNNEAKAFACLSAFVPKYLHNFFLKDNSAVIQEYLAKFSQLISFHDPELANHLHNINFYPELFAIPWFLTVFSHVFPLYKIMHLWDKLLLGDSSFPLHIGLSVLTQLRDRLLTAGFNECILLFSDLPEVDIEKCVTLSMSTFKSTPSSVTSRQHGSEKCHMKMEAISAATQKELNQERCPRISATDVVDLLQKKPCGILVVDIRNPVQYNRCAVQGSINVPFASVPFGDASIENIGHYATILKNSGDKIIVVVGSEDTDLDQFPQYLLKCGIGKVCVLHGGFNVLTSVTPTILTSQNQI